MQINSVKLHNIRSYTREEIMLPVGTLLLSGDIGAGKSTILLAIEFALFGIKRGALPAQSLLRNGASEGSVELSFKLSGKDFVINRKLKRQRGTIRQDAGYIIAGGKKTDLTPQGLKSHVFNLLGYPLNLVTKSDDMVYRYTVYTPQEDMKHILFSDPQERLDTLRRVFGIDKYKRVRENATLYVKELRGRVRELGGRILDLDDKKERFLEKQKKSVELTKSLDASKTEIHALKGVVESKEKSLKVAEDKHKSFEADKKQQEIIRAKIEEKKRQSLGYKKSQEELLAEIVRLGKEVENINLPKEIPDEPSLEKEILALELEFSTLREKRVLLIERKANLERKLADLSKEITELKAEFRKSDDMVKKRALIENNLSKRDTIAARKSEVEMQIEGAGKVIAESELMFKNAENVLRDIRDLRSCPTCLQEVPDDHKDSIIMRESAIASEQQKRIIASKEKMRTAQDKLLEYRKKLDVLQGQEVALERLSASLGMVEKNKVACIEKAKNKEEVAALLLTLTEELEGSDSTRVESLSANLAKKKEELVKARVIVKRVENKKYITLMLEEKRKQQQQISVLKESLSGGMRELEHQIKILDQKLHGSAEVGAELLKFKKDLEVSRASLQEKMLLRARVSSEHDVLEKTLLELKSEIDEKLEVQSRIKGIQTISGWIEEQFMNLMATIEKHVMVKINLEFNELFRNWFEMLVEDENFSVSIDDSFTPSVVQNGFEIDVKHLSGGEKTAVALAYRLALNKVINDLIKNIKTNDLIILDEPTDGFSSEQLDKVRDVLDQIGTDQTIIVSHDPKVESFVQNIIRIAKSEHVSRVA